METSRSGLPSRQVSSEGKTAHHGVTDRTWHVMSLVDPYPPSLEHTHAPHCDHFVQTLSGLKPTVDPLEALRAQERMGKDLISVSERENGSRLFGIPTAGCIIHSISSHQRPCHGLPWWRSG